MKFKTIVTSILSVIAAFSIVVSVSDKAVNVSAAKANGKYYVGSYIPGDNVSSSLTLRSSSVLSGDSGVYIYKSDYKDTSSCFTVSKVTSNNAGWVNSVKAGVDSNRDGRADCYESRSGYVNLSYCKEYYNGSGLWIIPDGTNNVDRWNEEYVTLWGSGMRIYAINYQGNIGGNYRMKSDEQIWVTGFGSSYTRGQVSKNQKTGEVKLEYLLPYSYKSDNNNRNKVQR